MQKEDIEFYIALALLAAIGIAVGVYLWHIQLLALSNCTKPCVVID